MSSLTSAEQRPATFLNLAPNTSNSYPREQRKSLSATTAPVESTSGDDAAAKSRASSLSSDGSGSSVQRVLKLGPVHWGEHQDDHKGDWHEVAVE